MDAQRRDLSLNALFYNINEGKVEDCTGIGLNDLKNRYCRTPIDPLITYSDDPLRLLRAIRFAQRFDFKICNEIRDAAHNNEIRKLFK